MIAWPLAAVLVLLALGAGFALGRRRPVRSVVWTAPSIPISSPDVESLIHSGRKIDAIRRYRELHGVGLKEAKEAVEALERQPPSSAG
jgi:hypothetical protein